MAEKTVRLLEGAARENVQRLKYQVDRIVRFNGRMPQQLPLMPDQLAALYETASVCEALLAGQRT